MRYWSGWTERSDVYLRKKQPPRNPHVTRLHNSKIERYGPLEEILGFLSFDMQVFSQKNRSKNLVHLILCKTSRSSDQLYNISEAQSDKNSVRFEAREHPPSTPRTTCHVGTASRLPADPPSVLIVVFYATALSTRIKTD